MYMSTDVDGEPLVAGEEYELCLSVLPMGFSWSFWIVQEMVRCRGAQLVRTVHRYGAIVVGLVAQAAFILVPVDVRGRTNQILIQYLIHGMEVIAGVLCC